MSAKFYFAGPTQHCSIAAVSPCTLRAVRNYFQNGTLPKEDTVCDTKEVMFRSSPWEDKDLDGLSDEERKIQLAAYAVAEDYPIMKFGKLI